MIRKGIIVTRDGMRLLGGPGSGNFGHAGVPGERGGSSSGGGGVSSGVLSGVSKGFAKMHADASIEHGMVLGADGGVKLKITGDAQKLMIPKDADVSGTHLIHNHPNERYPGLSPDDINTAITRNMGSITATGTTGDFIRIDMPDGGWPNLGKGDIKAAFDSTFDSIGGKTVNFKSGDNEALSKFTSDLSKKSMDKLGLKYTYE